MPSAGELRMYDDDGTETVTLRGNQNTGEGSEMFMSNDAGNITLELDGDFDAAGGGYLGLEDDLSNRRVAIYANEVVDQGAALYLYDNDGNRTIELDADFGGKGRVITDEIEITGGSDLAEYFESTDEAIRPGQVVIIDVENPGMVKISDNAFDKKVLGIVSGANGISPGMFMGQTSTIAHGELPIAIAGRVYVEVDESNGEIEPGDFLTTAPVAGKAMKVEDWDQARGAILGKALTSSR